MSRIWWYSAVAFVSLIGLEGRTNEAGSTPRTFVEDAIQSQMVLVAGGTFEMGSEFARTVTNESERRFFEDESPIHKVHLTRGFWVSATEVTVAQFRRFVQETRYITSAEIAGTSLGEYSEAASPGGAAQASWGQGKALNWRNPGYSPEDSQPVTHVSWNDAKAFCQWLADKTGRPYRLLSEAEWEWAAGGSPRTLYSWGNGEPHGKQGGNIADAAFGTRFPNWKYPVASNYQDYFVFPAPVGSYLPNTFGLFDMTGNVWEWVEDLYSPTYYQSSPAENPKGPSEPPAGGEVRRVHRGGGFDWELPYLRVAKRRGAAPQATSIHVGFRIALDAEPPLTSTSSK